jgi:hypothetical protein
MQLAKLKPAAIIQTEKLTAQIKLIIQAMLKISKLISFKFSNAELEQTKSIQGPAGRQLEATRTCQ